MQLESDGVIFLLSMLAQIDICPTGLGNLWFFMCMAPFPVMSVLRFQWSGMTGFVIHKIFVKLDFKIRRAKAGESKFFLPVVHCC